VVNPHALIEDESSLVTDNFGLGSPLIMYWYYQYIIKGDPRPSLVT